MELWLNTEIESYFIVIKCIIETRLQHVDIGITFRIVGVGKIGHQGHISRKNCLLILSTRIEQHLKRRFPLLFMPEFITESKSGIA